MWQLRWSAALVAVVVTSVLTACSGEGDRPSVPPVAFGTNVTLAPAPEVPKGDTPHQRRLPVVLDQNTAYIGSPTDVRIVATGSGQTVDTVRPSHPVYASGGPVGGSPVAATINGSRVVVWPFLVTLAPPDLVAAAPTGEPGDEPGSGPSGEPSSSSPTSAPDDAAPSDDGSPPPMFGGSAPASPPGTGQVVGPQSTSEADAPPSSSHAAAAPTDPSADPSAARPPSGTVVELASIRVDNHTATTALVTLPGWASAATSTLSVATIGVEGSTVLLGVTDGLAHAALAVDAVSGQTLWSRDNFAVGALVGHTAVGVEPDAALGAGVHVAGLDLADGKERWRQLRGYGLHVSPAGPTLVAAIGQLAAGSDRNTFQLLNADTGAAVARLPVPPVPSSRCQYDDTSVTVCYAPTEEPEDRAAVAVDAQTGKQLWAMPDYNTSNRQAPLVTAVWHGLVYGTTDGAETVVLRANNQAPVRTTPGAAPGVVGDHIGIAIDGNTIVARRPIV